MKYKLLGAIIGDIAGKPYEYQRTKVDSLDFDLKLNFHTHTFTDDTVCTIAIADAIVSKESFTSSLVKWCRKYYDRGYGAKFTDWVMGKEHPVLDSYGNGAAMRISPCGWLNLPLQKCLGIAEIATRPSHNHENSYMAAFAVTEAIWTCRNTDPDKEDLLRVFQHYYPGFDFSIPIEEIRKDYRFSCTCEGSVPHALRCFYESTSYEDCLKRCIWLGGDTDTTAAIAGSIAASYYKEIPEHLIEVALQLLPEEMIDVIERFDSF